MKQLGNAGATAFTVTQVESGTERTYTLLPGETLTVPLPDPEVTQQRTDKATDVLAALAAKGGRLGAEPATIASIIVGDPVSLQQSLDAFRDLDDFRDLETLCEWFDALGAVPESLQQVERMCRRAQASFAANSASAKTT